MDFDSEDDDDEGASQVVSGGNSCRNGSHSQAGINVSSHCRGGADVGEAELRAVFKDLDVDGSGSLTVEDLKKVLAKTGQADKAGKYIEQVDVNKDGKVDFEEFLKAWKAGL